MAENISAKPPDYRPDLDGLRALAVVPVVLYHLEVPGFPGGFVGVDVFFVLSGFLITRLLVADLEQNRFSLFGFYDRRIRRIVPALFVMLLFCTVAALLLLDPGDLRTFGESLAATALSLSNFHFARQTDYFAPNSELMPLLHTWSLAVEEQFYLLFPLLLWAAWRYAGKWFGAVIWLTLLSSLAWSIIGTKLDPDATFYLLPPRAWELLAGSVLALHLVPHASAPWQREAAVSAGILAILASVFLYSNDTAFPGHAALLPCIGTMLVIWAGIGASPSSLAARLLSAQIPVFIGLISYSIYLWHWPLIVFAKHLLEDDLSFKVMVLVLTIVLSTLSWLYVERPLRAGSWPWPTQRLRFFYSSATASILVAIGLTFSFSAGWPQRLTPVARQIVSHEKDFSPHRSNCHLRRYSKIAVERSCVLGAESEPKVVLIGDSHAVELSAALAELAQERNESIRQLTASACPPSSEFPAKGNAECKKFVEQSIALLANSPPSKVVLVAHYFSLSPGLKRKDDRYGHAPEQFWKGLETTARELRKAGHEVILLGGVPSHTYRISVPTALMRWVQAGNQPEDFRYPLDAKFNSMLEARLRALARSTGSSFVPITPYLCTDGIKCAAYMDETVMFFDDDHLSMSGARKVAAEVLAPVIWPVVPAAGPAAELGQ